jgi:hypothetical protein
MNPGLNGDGVDAAREIPRDRPAGAVAVRHRAPGAAGRQLVDVEHGDACHGTQDEVARRLFVQLKEARASPSGGSEVRIGRKRTSRRRTSEKARRGDRCDDREKERTVRMAHFSR